MRWRMGGVLRVILDVVVRLIRGTGGSGEGEDGRTGDLFTRQRVVVTHLRW